MKSVLFVDDEPNVLDGLRRMLRDQRETWHMEFAQSGEEALRRFEISPYDVVVSDMRMPGMDGAQLLEEITRRYPQTVRIILSGQSDRENVLRSIGPTHQFMAKPCCPEVLKTTLKRASTLRDRLADEQLVRLVSRIRSLPSVPHVCATLTKELQSQDVSLARVGEIISQDVAITAKILQLVNSAFFGLKRTVTDPAHAVALLGLDVIKALTLSMGVISQLDDECPSNAMLNVVVKHSIRTAVFAKRICELFHGDRQVANDAFVAGVLHDVGQLILMTDLPDQYVETGKLAAAASAPIWQVEESTLGASHCNLGAYLMGLWGIPDPIVEAVACHHSPSSAAESSFGPLTAVHVADVLVHDVNESNEIIDFDWEYLERVGVADRIDGWRALYKAEYQGIHS